MPKSWMKRQDCIIMGLGIMIQELMFGSTMTAGLMMCGVLLADDVTVT